MHKPISVLLSAVIVATFGLQGQPTTHTDTKGIQPLVSVAFKQNINPLADAPATAITASYTAPAAPAPVQQVESVQASAPVSSNAAKAFIYQHESGNNPGRMNSIGCYGLGQDCNNIVLNKCGANYACQDDYFTNYMLKRYGSWEAAMAFWQRTDARPYPGHWW